MLPILERSGMKCPITRGAESENVATDFYLAFSPEREDPGNKQFGLAQIPKVVGGTNPPSERAAAALYAQIVSRVVLVSSTRAAEMVKLLENIFRCVNIALVNELKLLGQRMDIDMWEVIDSAATKPFGFMPFYPGPGLGGHCIPVDPYYLSWKAREFDFATRFIELAGEINTSMPYHVVDSVAAALNDKQKSLKGSKILLLGVAYKKTSTICANRLRSSCSNRSRRAGPSSTTTIRISRRSTRCGTTIFRRCDPSTSRRRRLAPTIAC